MANEKIKFNQNIWFEKLNIALLELNKEKNLIFYLIHIGPITLQVIIRQESSFEIAMRSFYEAKISEEYIYDIPTIYCLDESYIERLPSLSFSKNALNLNNFSSRLSKEKRIINFDESRSLLKVFNVHDQTYLFFCESFETLPSWEIYSPLKEFIHFIALENNCWLSHAGSLCKKNKAVLLFGTGGNGKSTTTLSGLNNGFQTLGDDYVLLEDANGEFNAHAIYRTIKSFPSSILKLPGAFNKLERHTIEHTGKYVYIDLKDKDTNFFTGSAKVIMNFGLHLQKKIGIGNNDIKNFDARYLSLSSIEQIPFWIDKSINFSENLFNQVGHKFSSSEEGLITLEKNMMIINKYFEDAYI